MPRLRPLQIVIVTTLFAIGASAAQLSSPLLASSYAASREENSEADRHPLANSTGADTKKTEATMTGITTLISVASDGAQGNGRSGYYDSTSISTDGRFVVFDSLASNLVSNDDNNCSGFLGFTNCPDIFVHDRLTGQTKRVSVDSNGTEGDSASALPLISGNSHFVAFHSYSDNLVSDDTNGTWDAFVHDLQTGQTTRVSVASDGTQGNGKSGPAAITADGRLVLLVSQATNLVANDSNNSNLTCTQWFGAPGCPDLYLHDRQTSQTTLISIATDGTQANSASGAASISPDGRYVAFGSWANNLVGDDTNNVCDVNGDAVLDNCPDIFIHDRQTGQTARVSVASDGTQGNGVSNSPAISADGRYVVFESDATNLVSNDTNGVRDVFIHDQQTGQTTRVSTASDGTEGNQASSQPSISADGRYVIFSSTAFNLVNNDSNIGYSDIFVHDMWTGQTELASVASNGVQGNNHSVGSIISANSRFVAFQSDANNLTNLDTNGERDVFIRDRCPDGSCGGDYYTSGRVRDAHNNPISSVIVLAGMAGNAITDPSGYYTVTGLVTGTYTITPTKARFTFSPITRTVSVPPDAIGQNFVGSIVDISFRPYPNGYEIVNDNSWYSGDFTTTFDFSTNDMGQLFGDEFVCESVVLGHCFLTLPAQQWYDNVAIPIIRGGHCDGMAATSLRFFKGWDQLPQIQSGAVTAYDLDLFHARRHLSYYQVLQKTPVTSEAIRNTEAQTPTQVLSLLQASFSADLPYTLIIIEGDYDGAHAHALVPYRLTDRGNGIWWIWVYDPNYPFNPISPLDSNRYAVLNTATNTWTYTGSFGTWSGEAMSHTLRALPLLAYQPHQHGQCPWCVPVDPVLPSIAQISLNDVGHLLITDPTGRRLGYVGGQYYSEIPSAVGIPVISSGLVPQEPTYYLPLTSTYTITLDGTILTQTQAATMRQFGPGYAVGVDSTLSPSTQDQITITPDGARVSYRANENHSVGFVLTSDVTQTASYEFDVRSPLIAGKVITLSNNSMTGKLIVNNYDGSISGSYRLSIDRVSAVGEQFFEHSDIAISTGETDYVLYGTWDGHGDMALEIDHGSDGTIDQTVMLTNEHKFLLYLPLILRNQ
jgi:Tol biopolymer transport system component